MNVFSTVSFTQTRPLENGEAFHTSSWRGMDSPLRAYFPAAGAWLPLPVESFTLVQSIPGREQTRETTGSSRESTKTYRERYPSKQMRNVVVPSSTKR